MARKSNEEQARPFARADWKRLTPKQQETLMRSDGGGSTITASMRVLVRRDLVVTSKSDGGWLGEYYSWHRTPWGHLVLDEGRRAREEEEEEGGEG